MSQLYESHQPEELLVEASSDCEAVWVKIKVQGSSDLYVGPFYRPPDKNKAEYLQGLPSIMSRFPTDKGAQLWLGGDFNFNITWEEESVVPYATYSAVSNQLLTIVKDMYICTLTKGYGTHKNNRNFIKYLISVLYKQSDRSQQGGSYSRGFRL